jgi:hypothetical protein
MKILSTTALVLTTIICSGPASAYTQEQQMACQDDAFRVCSHLISITPDEARIRACLIANVERLTPACRRMVQPSAASR